MKQKNIVILISITIVILVLVYTYLTNNSKPPFPIDVVYTWKGEEVTENVRTSYNHELKYSLRSIDLHAPWAKKIS